MAFQILSVTTGIFSDEFPRRRTRPVCGQLLGIQDKKVLPFFRATVIFVHWILLINSFHKSWVDEQRRAIESMRAISSPQRRCDAV